MSSNSIRNKISRFFSYRKIWLLCGQLLIVFANIIRNKVLAVNSIDLFAATTLALTTVQFFNDFAVFGTDLIALKFKQNVVQNDENEFTTNFVAYYFFLSLVSVLGFFIFLYFIPEYFNSLGYSTILFIPLMIILCFVNLSYISIRKAQNKLTGLFKVNLVIFFGVLTSLFFIFFENSDLFITSAIVIPTFLNFIYVLFDLRNEFRLNSIKWDFIKNNIMKEFKYGFVFSLASMLPVLIFMLIRIMLVQLDESLYQLSYFVVGFSMIHSYFGLILNAFSQDIISKFTQGKHKDSFILNNLKKESKIALIISILIATLFFIFGRLILQLIYSKEFEHVYLFLLFGIPGLIIRSFSYIQNLIYVIKNKSNNLFKLEFTYNVSFLVFSIIFLKLTKDFIYIGLAYSLSYIIYFIYSFYDIKRILKKNIKLVE